MAARFIGIDGEVMERIKAIMKFRSGELFSVDIQKLVFYADCKAVEMYARRFSNLEFKPMMYGAYSQELSEAIHYLGDNDDSVITETAIRNGSTDKQYSYIGRLDLDDAVIEFIKKVLSETSSLDTSDLTNLSKNNIMYREASRGEPLSFSDYREALKSDKMYAVTGSYKPEVDTKDAEWTYPLKP